MATATAAYEQTRDQTGADIYDADSDGVTGTTISIRCRSGSALLVNVPGLHAAGQFARIPIGAIEPFAINGDNLTTVFVKGEDATATLDWFLSASRAKGT